MHYFSDERRISRFNVVRLQVFVVLCYLVFQKKESESADKMAMNLTITYLASYPREEPGYEATLTSK